MGGKKKFVDKLQKVFDEGLYDFVNELDIVYFYLFSYFKGEEWCIQKQVKCLFVEYFIDWFDGIFGNDDIGMMLVWVIFSMIGLYFDCLGMFDYMLIIFMFDKVIIQLDLKYYKEKELVIIVVCLGDNVDLIKEVKLNGKKYVGYCISYEELVYVGKIEFILK